MSQLNGQTNGLTRIPWHRLRAWIDEQEAHERRTGQPADLTQQQISAIQALIPIFNQPCVNQDFVSLLNLHLQQTKQAVARWIDYDPVSVTIGAGSQLRWRLACEIPGVEGEFPREGYGFEAGQDAPTFQSKKVAKQFAAQQAYVYLSSIPKAATAAAAAAAASSGSGSGGSFGGGSGGGFGGGSGGGSGGGFGSGSGAGAGAGAAAHRTSPSMDEEDARVFQRIDVMAKELKLGSVTFKIEQDGAMWKGRPRFQCNEARVPHDVGVVKDVYGSKNKARLAAATEVLEWMEGEMRRQAEESAYLLRSQLRA